MSRKNHILSIATGLFRTKGKAHTSIRQIANASSVSHSLLHKHWVSKDDLYLDCLKTEVDYLVGLLNDNGDRAELTIYYLLKHPQKWSLVARCLSMSPPSTGEEKRFEKKAQQLLSPVLDHLLDVSKKMARREGTEELENAQIGKTWFFIIMSIFSGHCLLHRTLLKYLGEADLKAARRITIDAFYENCIFNKGEILQ